MKPRQITAALLALSMCLLISASASNKTDDMRYKVNSKTTREDVQFNANVASTNQASANLNAAFYNNYMAKSNKNSSTDIGYTSGGIPSDGYPDYYAGSYINENGNLVVRLKSDAVSTPALLAQVKAQAEALTGNSSIVFNITAYSHRELIEAMIDIKNYVQTKDWKSESYFIKAFEICVTENTANVYLASVGNSSFVVKSSATTVASTVYNSSGTPYAVGAAI